MSRRGLVIGMFAGAVSIAAVFGVAIHTKVLRTEGHPRISKEYCPWTTLSAAHRDPPAAKKTNAHT